jgi:hypothetical protein
MREYPNEHLYVREQLGQIKAGMDAMDRKIDIVLKNQDSHEQKDVARFREVDKSIGGLKTMRLRVGAVLGTIGTVLVYFGSQVSQWFWDIITRKGSI